MRDLYIVGVQCIRYMLLSTWRGRTYDRRTRRICCDHDEITDGGNIEKKLVRSISQRSSQVSSRKCSRMLVDDLDHRIALKCAID